MAGSRASGCCWDGTHSLVMYHVYPEGNNEDEFGPYGELGEAKAAAISLALTRQQVFFIEDQEDRIWRVEADGRVLEFLFLS